METFRKISVADIWVPPLPKTNKLKPSGCEIIDTFAQHLRNGFPGNVKDYAKVIGISPKGFSDIVLYYTGDNAAEWRNEFIRVDAEWYLIYTMKSVTEIAETMGCSPQTINSAIRKYRNMSPVEFRNSSRTVTIEHKITPHI